MKRLAFILVLFLSSNSWAMRRWPFSYTHEIKIRIIDEDTREPVSGVIAIANWAERRYQLMGSHSGIDYNTKKIMSDKWGEILVPPKFSLNIIGPFIEIDLRFHHPLYTGAYLLALNEQYDTYQGKSIEVQPDAVIVKIKSLKEKYKNVKCYAEKVGKEEHPFFPSIRDTCRESSHYFFNDLIESKKFYSEYPAEEVLKFSQDLFPSIEETQSKLTQIYENIYKKSNYRISVSKWIRIGK